MALTSPDFLRPLLAQPVAILGAGVSGQGVASLLSALGAKGVIYDEKGAEFSSEAASRHSLAVFSPGFAPGHPWLGRAHAAGCASVGEIDFASIFWRGRIIAVTGTNGKTTLAEFLTHALIGIGRNACATGNIGRAFSGVAADADGAADGIAVCEVSSFQAEVLGNFRADATLWTNFAEDHLERHGSMEAYFAAKENLVGRSDKVFAGSSVKKWHGLSAHDEVGRVVLDEPRLTRLRRTTPWQAGDGSPYQHGLKPMPLPTWVETEGQPRDPGLDGTVFADYPQRENFLLAAAWWRAAGHETGALYAAARTFHLGRHRCARVAEIDGVVFWNDSKATNYHATEAALARFDAPVLLIAGGRAKGGDLAGFVRRIAPRVRHGFLIGETRGAMAGHCRASGIPHTVCAALDDAVRSAVAMAGPGDNVVLSPAFASFDMFRNYEDRGDQFERIVHANLNSKLRPLSSLP